MIAQFLGMSGDNCVDSGILLGVILVIMNGVDLLVISCMV